MKLRCLLIAKTLISFLLITTLAFPQKNIKVLVLIIASDQLPVYQELQKMWQSYMHYDPQHVEAYFIKGDINLPVITEIKDDVIWSKTDEGWVPESAGIINKTIFSLQAMLPRLREFDYVLRTNLSSFYIFPRLLKFLETAPKRRFYCGSGDTDDDPIASGCGFIMSPDVVKLLIKNKWHFLNNNLSPDDCLIGHFLQKHRIKRTPHHRMDIPTIEFWNEVKNMVSSELFHFRVKNAQDHLRSTDEIFIQSQLLNMFYS